MARFLPRRRLGPFFGVADKAPKDIVFRRVRIRSASQIDRRRFNRCGRAGLTDTRMLRLEFLPILSAALVSS